MKLPTIGLYGEKQTKKITLKVEHQLNYNDIFHCVCHHFRYMSDSEISQELETLDAKNLMKIIKEVIWFDGENVYDIDTFELSLDDQEKLRSKILKVFPDFK